MDRSFRRLIFSMGVATVLVALILNSAREEEPPQQKKQPGPPQISQPEIPIEKSTPPPAPPLLADQLLASYGKPTGTLASDMELFDRYLSNVFILTKSREPRYYATNKDLVLFLTGQKGNLTPFLSPDWALLNDQGQILDRVGNPLIVHPLSRDKIEIRSAGPDGIPYTEDDIVR